MLNLLNTPLMLSRPESEVLLELVCPDEEPLEPLEPLLEPLPESLPLLLFWSPPLLDTVLR